MFNTSFQGRVKIGQQGPVQLQPSIRQSPKAVSAQGSKPLMAQQQPRFLGQVNLVTGPSSTPFYATPPTGYFANPSGNPLMTPEITSPQSEHIAREFHCMSKGGQFTSVPMAQRDAYLANGWEDTDYSNCGGPPLHAQPVGTPGPILMGQNRLTYPVIRMNTSFF